MENTPEITAIHPHEPGEAPEGYVKMPIPFVGIYQTLLGADIDCLIDQEIDRCNEENTPCKEIKIHYDEIYSSIALYTADLLGIKGALYAGTVCPKYYNFKDDQPYLFVPEKFHVEHFGDPYEEGFWENRKEIILQTLYEELDPWYLNEYGHCIEDAVYAQWANGTNNGYEEILENLEIIS